jgi:hypothetical protein
MVDSVIYENRGVFISVCGNDMVMNKNASGEAINGLVKAAFISTGAPHTM